MQETKYYCDKCSEEAPCMLTVLVDNNMDIETPTKCPYGMTNFVWESDDDKE